MFDPANPTLRQRLRDGQGLGAVWLSLGSAALAEIAARARPDVVVLDLQHGLWERREMEAAIGAVPADIPVMVRIARNGETEISTALDAGAEGVIVPLVESAKEAEAAVRAAHFPPRGGRSGGGVRPLGNFVSYVEAANRGVTVCVMIETASGVKNAKAIAGVDGVDLVFIGTGDLALSLGTFPQFGAKHEKACKSVLAACRSKGTPCGIFTMSADAAAARRSEGYVLTVVGNDIDIAGQGFAKAVAAFGKAGE